MKRYLKLYGWLLLQQIKIKLEYPLDFILSVVSQIFIQGTGFLTIWVVMAQVPKLNGWNFYEVALIYGLLTLSFAVSVTFTSNLWFIGYTYIRSGDFDRLLVRPIDPLFHVVMDTLNYSGFGDFISGFVMVIGSTWALGLAWTPGRILYLAFAVLTGAAIFIGTYLITADTAFWIMDSQPLTYSVFKNFEFAKYPLSVFPRAIQFLLTWLIPYGFASYYPASYLLGHDTGPMAWVGVIVAVVLLFIGRRLWFVGLRRYSGAGS